MTEKEFANLYGFDISDMDIVKPSMRMFNGTIVNTVRRTAEEMRSAGIAKAEESAEVFCPNWGQIALDAVREFIEKHSGNFQAEDIRMWAKQVPPAPSARAWGSVMLKAARMGLIRSVGYATVDNPLAHGTPATLWVKA